MKAFSVIALCVFGIGLSLATAITGIYSALPPGNMFEGMWRIIVNGLFYGFIAWLIYAVAVSLRGPKPEAEIVEPKPKMEVEAPQPKVPLEAPQPEMPQPEVPEVEAPLPEVTLPEVPLPKVTLPEAPEVEVPQPEVPKELKIVPKKTGIPIIDIEGIGPVYSKKLNSIGIRTTNDLLEAGKTRIGRQEISEKTEISEKLILEWVNLADLFRIRGVGEEYSDLLEEAGVDTVIELSGRNPDNLYAKLLLVNEDKKLVRRLPTVENIKSWIEQAKALPRKIEY